MKNKTYNKKKVLVVFLAAVAVILGLIEMCIRDSAGRAIYWECIYFYREGSRKTVEK